MRDSLNPDAQNLEIKNGEIFEKNYFIKYFAPFKWIIGTGEFLDYYEEMTQQSIVRHLNRIGIGLESPDYVFIYKLHNKNGGDKFATMLVNPNRPDLVGKKVTDSYIDAQGKMFRKEMLKGVREKGEAFVTYMYNKPGSDDFATKLSYFKYYPELDWIIANGTYLDYLDKRVAQMQNDLRFEIKNTISYLVYFLVIICIIFLFVAYIFSKCINSLFEGYKKKQKEQQVELKRVNTDLKVLATTDSLTELYNRGYLNTHIEREIARIERYKPPLSIINFDIDKFKRINDTLGHLTGDNILIELSDLCQSKIRKSDILARWGGDEFIILVPGIDLKSAVSLAEKLRKNIEEHPFEIEFKVTCSFGVTQYIEGEGKDNFINRSDKALYEAKNQNRNKVISL